MNARACMLEQMFIVVFRVQQMIAK